MYGSRSGGLLSSKKVCINQVCYLKNASVNLANNAKVKFGFEFYSEQKSFGVVTSSAEEANQWVNAIQKQIDMSGGANLGFHAKMSMAKMRKPIGPSGTLQSTINIRDSPIARHSIPSTVASPRTSDASDMLQV